MKALRKPYVITAVVGALVLASACGGAQTDARAGKMLRYRREAWGS